MQTKHFAVLAIIVLMLTLVPSLPAGMWLAVKANSIFVFPLLPLINVTLLVVAIHWLES